MQITIDTSERLDDVLRVVGAAYGVTLTTSGAATGRRAASAAGGRATGATGGSAEIRAWARAHGRQVKDRGRIPAEIVAEYRAATRRRRS